MSRKLGGGDTETSFRANARKYQGNINPQTQTSAQIAQFLKERNITKLFHFTDKSNLDNILNFGFLSRNMLDTLQWIYSFNDDKRLDGRLDFISLSMSRVNEKLLDSFILKGKIKECVIVEIDATMLYREDNERIYCQTNAATKRAKKGGEFKDLVAMFDDEISYCTNYDGVLQENKIKRNERNLNDNEPTAPQAEILWKDWINPNYIKGIYFYNGETNHIKQIEPRKIIIISNNTNLTKAKDYHNDK